MDGLLSLGVDSYHGVRNIAVTTQTAISKYQGMQYGGKLKAGFTLPIYTIEISPMGTVQYSALTQQGYIETGAYGANLSVSPVQVNQIQIGLGGRIAEVSQDDFLPELHVLCLYDTEPPKFQVTSQFIDVGGGSFIVTGVNQARAGINVGRSITTLMTEQFMVIASYDLEAKKGFMDQSVLVKFKWLF